MSLAFVASLAELSRGAARQTIAALCITAFLFTGCSAKKPSEAEGRQILQSMVEDQAKGLIKLVLFLKQNGMELGTNGYKMDFQAMIQFEDDCLWGDPPSGRRPFLATRGIPAEGTLAAQSAMFNMKGHKGERHSLFGHITFEKTENGWRSADVEFR